MFWYSETVKGAATDWRPEIHDSDGLAMWNGEGEHLWRPLNDPPTLNISAFIDETERLARKAGYRFKLVLPP